MLASTLIVGTTGSGKSYFLNQILSKQAEENSAMWVLIDPKRVELHKWTKSHAQNVLYYADNTSDFYVAVNAAYSQMMIRLDVMQQKGITETDEKPIYVVVDEMALLMSDRKHAKSYGEMLGKIAVIGRAAHVYVIACTQVPTRKSLPNELVDNITNSVVLRLRDMSRARYVFGPGFDFTGHLPAYGVGYLMSTFDDQPRRMDTSDMLEEMEV